MDGKKEMTMKEIQNVLWDEIHKLRNDETKAGNVQAITNAAGKILNTYAIEMKYAQLTGKTPAIPVLDQRMK